VIFKAMGRAINKSVTVVEITKRRIEGLHQVAKQLPTCVPALCNGLSPQITDISSVDIVDAYEPLEEGLDRVETTRHVPCVQITLSRDPLDESNAGYQPPLDPSEVMAASMTASDTGTSSLTAHHHHLTVGLLRRGREMDRSQSVSIR
jgi:hypothetical protein